MPGLHIVATPIGNLGDVTLRALATLAAADTIYCEDTRVTQRLLQRYGIKSPLSPYHDHNAAKLRPLILERLRQGAALALVSDAGTPLISDPGYKLVREVIAEGLKVEIVPGASAVIAAMALSGLPTDRFMFCGFMPQKATERRHLLEALNEIDATLVFYESANRTLASLGAIGAVFGERQVAVARELTKLHEECVRGTASEVLRILAERESIKGEITLVVAPPDAHQGLSADEIDAGLIEAAKTEGASQAAAKIARQSGLSKRELYARLLELKADGR